MRDLRLQPKHVVLIVLGLTVVLIWPLLLSRFLLNLGFVEFSKSMTSGEVGTCRGEPASLSRAQRLGEMALRTQEDDAIYEFLGEIHLWGGEAVQTIEAWKKTGYPITYYLAQAENHHRQGQSRCALDQYAALNSIWPDSSLPWYYRGNTLRSQKVYADAVDAYDRAIALNDFQGDSIRTGDAYLQEGETLRDANSVADAYNGFLAATNSGDFSTPLRESAAYYRQGEMLVWMGRYTEAVDPLNKAIDIAPYFYNAYSLLGFVFLQQGDYIQAERSLQTALSLEPKYLWTHLFLAAMYNRMGDANLAIEHYVQVLELDPQNNQALEALQQLNQSD